MSNIRKGSFVAISDFHSYEWPIKKIKNHYLNEFETIYILGDATDRGEKEDGTGGIALLQEIKKLTEMYPGRVVYIPGNHDDFVYQYAKYSDYRARWCMENNHGIKTIKELDKLRKKKPEEFNELIEWLGNLPLQREHYFEEQRYVLAHALFDEQLFKRRPNLSLEEYGKMFHNMDERDILWFRKAHDSYDKERLPRGNAIMVIGHTPQRSREGLDLDLVNAYGEKVEVHCVDGGIAYGGTMQKYYGGETVFDTLKDRHAKPVFESNKEEKPIRKSTLSETEKEQLELSIHNIIMEYINKYDTFEKALREFIKETYESNEPFVIEEDRNCSGKKKYNIDKSKVREHFEELLLSSVPSNKDNDTKMDYQFIYDVFKSYFSKIAFDFIITCQVMKFKSYDTVIYQQESFEKHEDYDYITNSMGHARDIARKVRLENLREWIEGTEYLSLSDYIRKTRTKQYINA